MSATRYEMPAHEAAPAHLYDAEAAAYYRRFRLAVAVAAGLMVATGHAERLQTRPGRREYEQHQHDVHEFARLARRCLEANPKWCPGGMYSKWLTGRAVRWDEVVAVIGGAGVPRG